MNKTHLWRQMAPSFFPARSRWIALVLSVGLVAPSAEAADLSAQTLTPEEAKAITTDAYI